ncbi:Serine/threonine-protein kinase haspin [Blyttiomyces sp. JEL0837]|nr:Serine/threonine-protein kinase haspin [Blyttiomyces sp. JEL0837]
MEAPFDILARDLVNIDEDVMGIESDILDQEAHQLDAVAAEMAAPAAEPIIVENGDRLQLQTPDDLNQDVVPYKSVEDDAIIELVDRPKPDGHCTDPENHDSSETSSEVGFEIALSDHISISSEEEVDRPVPVKQEKFKTGRISLSELLRYCGQSDPISLEEAFAAMDLVCKLGEATYSEVYSCRLPNTDAPEDDEQKINVAVKVMPFGGNDDNADGPLVNGSAQISVHDVAQEVFVTRALGGCEWNEGLSKCHGKDRDRKIRMVKSGFVDMLRGPYASALLEEWDRWEEDRGSENDRPDYFPATQLYAVLVLVNGGTDLEHTKLRTWPIARSALLQVVLSLSWAESELSFEHRDLHWGNVLFDIIDAWSVRSANPHAARAALSKVMMGGGGKSNGVGAVVEEAPEDVVRVWVRSGGGEGDGLDLDGVVVEVPLSGVKATIIDFTLSRCEKDGKLFYVALDDEELFTGEGDYQFEIYRMMKNETKGDWEGFYPKTNVMWIHYLVDKLLTAKTLPHAGAAAKQYRKSLESLRSRVLQYDSCHDLVVNEIIRTKTGDGGFLKDGFRVL